MVSLVDRSTHDLRVGQMHATRLGSEKLDRAAIIVCFRGWHNNNNKACPIIKLRSQLFFFNDNVSIVFINNFTTIILEN